jgi:hypothetical protein
MLPTTSSGMRFTDLPKNPGTFAAATFIAEAVDPSR